MTHTTYWIITHPPTRRHIPIPTTGKFSPPAAANRELTATDPPRLYRTKKGAETSLRVWLKGRVRYTGTIKVTWGSPTATSKSKYIYEPQADRDAIAHEMQVLPVSLLIGE